MIAQIQLRRGTTAEWAAASPAVLAAGEPGWDSTLKGMKVGDGSTEWAALPWIDAKNRPDINAATLDGNTIAQIKLLMYPVGSIYESTVSTSPATLFGGTWSALEGRMLIGADGTYGAGTTGGAATGSFGLSNGYAKVSLSATGLNVRRATVSAYAADRYTNVTSTSTTVNVTLGAELGGTTDAGPILPPYLSVYMWKRTA